MAGEESTADAVRTHKGPALVVGLGNPGMEYQFTPHNVGFLAIDRLAEQSGIAVTNRRCRSLTATTRIAGRDVVLAKPETFMNLSGNAVQALMQEFATDAQRDLIVIYDEIALSLGTLRIRERGSSGGHNGVKSVSGALGSEEWLRIRIGVAPQDEDAAERARRGRKDYVLAPMRKMQLGILDEVLDRTARAVEMVLAHGAGPAMNEFNRRETATSNEIGRTAMQRTYEVMFIVRPDILDEDLDKLITSLEGNITQGGGSIKSLEKLGRRKLAYMVKKFNDGNYVLLTINADGSLMSEIERRLRVSEPVIKFISVRMDEEEKRVAKIKAIRATRKKLSAQPPAAAPAPAPVEAAAPAAPAPVAPAEVAPAEVSA